MDGGAPAPLVQILGRDVVIGEIAERLLYRTGIAS
jgi:hypothetical protein